MRAASAVLILAGAAACSLLAFAATMAHGPAVIAGLERRTALVLAGTDVNAEFRDSRGWLTRHPVLRGGAALSGERRAALAAVVAGVSGVGGARWGTGARRLDQTVAVPAANHCQDDVEGIIRVRTIRFAEASATIDPASMVVLDEVAAALRPCLGSIIAVTGHTDAGGDAAANVALSGGRAAAVRLALVQRGIPAGGLRAKGVGAAEPVAGLEPADPANRRIEFSVIAPAPLAPTPIDTPGPG